MVELKEPIPAGGNRQSSAFTSTLTRHSKTYPAIDPTQSSLSAKGSVVLITGGGQGIGLSIALGFAKAGASHSTYFTSPNTHNNAYVHLKSDVLCASIQHHVT